MALTVTSLLDFGLAPGAEVFTRGFSGYVVPITADAALLAQFARTDSVDLTASRIALLDGEPVGGALIARRGRTSRLAGMALVPAARGRGVGREFMTLLLAEARARRETTMVLEVIEQNEPAVKLYERCGFTRVRRLVGHSGRPVAPAAASDAGLVELDPREFAGLVAVHGLADLPWQLSAETLAHATPPTVAFRLGASAALITDPTASVVGLRGIVTAREARGQGSSLALLQALQARFPGKEWRASAIYPEEMAPTFTAAGLARTPLTQWQMTLPL